jgi:Zn-dependent protease
MTATDTTTATFPCPRCGTVLPYGALACSQCGALIYTQRLNEIAAEAMREESGNPLQAATLWQQALPLLPSNSRQYHDVAARIGALSGQAGVAPPPGIPLPPPGASASPPRAEPQSDPLGLAVLKTAGSMLLSIVVYVRFTTLGWAGATGFTLLMLIHELGHLLAIRYFGLKASPPIFIPFLGALINLRQPPRNALEEAVVGIGGPVTGTIAAAVTYLIFVYTDQPLFLNLALFGFFLNLFNMLPVPPLDGGRITAAVSPWIWLPGLLATAAFTVWGILHGSTNFILILLLIYAWPRVKHVLANRGRMGAYYQISRRASVGMGAAYLALGLFLLAMFVLSLIKTQRFGGSGISF